MINITRIVSTNFIFHRWKLFWSTIDPDSWEVTCIFKKSNTLVNDFYWPDHIFDIYKYFIQFILLLYFVYLLSFTSFSTLFFFLLLFLGIPLGHASCILVYFIIPLSSRMTTSHKCDFFCTGKTLPSSRNICVFSKVCYCMPLKVGFTTIYLIFQRKRYS